jgi:hypothetical protein
MAEEEEVRAVLFVCESQGVTIAMPMLVRSLESFGEGHRDVTSVYGYPGPVASVEHPDEAIVRRFGLNLREYLESQRVVSAFSRLHPLLHPQQGRLLSHFGQILNIGPTVAIDLTLPNEAQWNQYRSNHKRDIQKAREEGIVCVCDVQWTYLRDFIEIYYQNMRRVDANDDYFFDRSYFARLSQELGDRLRLFVALREDVAIAGGLFTVCDWVIQYHLGGTRTEYLHLAPMKLIIEEARRWAIGTDAMALHLGGGVGAKKDGLLHFKLGFSDKVHRFAVWRAIVDQEVYQTLTQKKQAWNEQHGLRVVDAGYFPAYRAPTRGKIEGAQ